MLPLDLHIIWSESYVGNMLRGVEAIFFIFLLWFSQNLSHEGLSIG